MADSGISVLVVEDEHLVRMDIVMWLEADGFTVFEASTPKAIVVLNARSDIRLMSTDIDMPGSMHGVKLAVAVRDRWPPVMIIVTSGHRYMSDTLLPVAGEFFSNPYDHTRVISTMREMVASA
jgi:DNA-binding NtrC family response regulator